MNYKALLPAKGFCSRPFGAGRRLLVSGLLLVLVFSVVGGISGCNTRSIHLDGRYNPPVYWGRHVVKQGETLYSIAWRYGRDYRELGNANGISPPFNIRAGQVLRLDLKGEAPRQTAASPRSPQTAPSRSSSAPATRSPTSRPTPAAAPRVTSQPDRSVELAKQTQTVSDIRWQWPHVGTVIANFSTSGKINKGIDISGNSGDPVKAAAAGNVVYAGGGLLGYGNLIIINHNEHYLSAYAHNRRILVQEGEEVKAGQTIAELGGTGTDSNKLHFEIRRNGNPVDPMPYLPSR